MIVRIGLAVMVLSLALSGCADGSAGSSNVMACGLYETAYNQLADTVAAEAGDEAVEQQLQITPSMLAAAEKSATGEVAAAMKASDASLQSMAAGAGTSGAAFFASGGEVASSCDADGSAISLHPTS